MSQYQTIPSMYKSIINNHFLNDHTTPPPPFPNTKKANRNRKEKRRKMFTFLYDYGIDMMI